MSTQRYEAGARVEVRDPNNNMWFAATIVSVIVERNDSCLYRVQWDWSRAGNFPNEIVSPECVRDLASLSGTNRARRAPERFGFDAAREERINGGAEENQGEEKDDGEEDDDLLDFDSDESSLSSIQWSSDSSDDDEVVLVRVVAPSVTAAGQRTGEN